MSTKRTGIWRRIIWIFNLLAMAALALSYLAAYVSPATVWWLALFGLGYEILLVINVLFVLLWLLLRDRRFVLPLVLILLGISRFFGIFQINSDKTGDAENSISIMSFNVRLFDLYNWFRNNETRQKIFDFLKDESPDIVCFQEFYTSEAKKPAFRNRDTLHKILKAPYSHVVYTVKLRGTDCWGIATYSKYPIINKGEIHFSEKGGNIFIYSDIKAGDDTFRVFNTHLESIRLAWSDYKFIENLGNDEIRKDEFTGGLNIIRRLRKAFIRRGAQVEQLHDSLEASPYPVILCGDFNDTPSSYAYEILSDDLKDSFRESGNGFGKSYAGPFPSFRIDYIFHDPRITSSGYKTHDVTLSDHYPVSCRIRMD